jgi:hypothetical protein
MQKSSVIVGLSLLLGFVPLTLAHPPAHPNLGGMAEAPTPPGTPPQADEPGNHGMFVVGEKTLFLIHMPMFTNEKHMYQVVLRAHMSDEAMALYRKLRAANPSKPYNLINVDADKFTLPDLKAGKVRSFQATMFDGYSNDDGGTPGPVLADNIPVSIDDVVVFQHFNFGVDRPANLIYTVFGQGDETHMSHIISRDPDFQHIVTLSAPPPGFSAPQIESGVELNFTTLPSSPIGCESPLSAQVYPTLFAGRSDAPVPLDLTKGFQSIWYSTGNALNKVDPCEK